MFCSVYFILLACIYVIVVYVVNTLYIGKRGLYVGPLSSIEKIVLLIYITIDVE